MFHIRQTRRVILGFTMSMLAVSAVASASKVNINFWMPMSGRTKQSLQDVCNLYTKAHPDVVIKIMQVDNNLATSEKFIAAMAAGRPPEVVAVDGPQVIQWAAKGLLTPLDSYYKKSAVKPSDFWSPSWKQTLLKGNSYAYPWISDPNFPLFYNKSLFDEAGIGSPPKTIEEMTLYNDKLTKLDASGMIQKFGIMPWQSYGYANSLFTFGWAFGGEFYDADKDKVTCTDPKVIQCLQWMSDIARRYDWQKIARYSAGWVLNGNKDPFLTGKLAMMLRVSDFIKVLDYAPKGFEYGWSFVPGRAGGEKSVAWLGGWTLGIPANAKNRDKVWQFIKWFCSDPKATEEVYKTTGIIPSAKNSLAFKNHDLKMTPWVETLKIADHQRPVMLVTPVYFSELDRVVPQALEGKKGPNQALTDANNVIQKELDRAMGRLTKRTTRK